MIMMETLAQKMRKARDKLQNVQTRVVTPGGRELIESRSAAAGGGFTSRRTGVARWGFVGDYRPDLQMAMVRPRLFVGSQDPASDLRLLRKHGISHIVNVATYVENYYPEQIQYLAISILDLPNADIQAHFDTCNLFIQSALDDAEGAVYVHCNAGVSRSVSVVLAYLLWRERPLTYAAALEGVKAVRKCARPNEGFVRQLKAYEQKLRREEGVKKSMSSSAVQTEASTGVGRVKRGDSPSGGKAATMSTCGVQTETSTRVERVKGDDSPLGSVAESETFKKTGALEVRAETTTPQGSEGVKMSVGDSGGCKQEVEKAERKIDTLDEACDGGIKKKAVAVFG